MRTLRPLLLTALPLLAAAVALLFMTFASELTGVVRVARAALADSGAVIKPLLPEKLGEAVCFTGTFDGKRVELQDWRDPALEPVPGLVQFGQQVMRPKPSVRPDQGVKSLTLSLTYDDREADYDWIYNFLLRADMVAEPGALYAAGECPWYDKPDEGAGGLLDPSKTPVLGCYIDCDGGGFSVERVAGAGELDLSFTGYGIGLRMSAGCNGGSYRLGTGGSDPHVLFRLKRADPAACAPLSSWLERS